MLLANSTPALTGGILYDLSISSEDPFFLLFYLITSAIC